MMMIIIIIVIIKLLSLATMFPRRNELES